jgi:hypothetical protein
MKYLFIAILTLAAVSCKQRYKRNCDFVLPHQYYLVQDTVTKEYAIQFMHIDVFKYYLQRYESVGQFIAYRSFASANEATTFKDSCEAKGFAFEALEWIKKENSDNHVAIDKTNQDNFK